MLFEDLFDLHKHFFRFHLRIYVIIFANRTVVLDDILSLVLVGCEPFLDTVNIVITSATSLASFEESVCHDLLTAFEMEDERQVYFIVHLLLPFLEVLDVSGETVDQKSAVFETCFLHSVFKKANCDFTGDYFTFNDIFFDDLSELRSWSFSFSSKEVTS